MYTISLRLRLSSLCILVSFCFLGNIGYSQNSPKQSSVNSFSIDSVENRIVNQLLIYPQEKIHVHMDKSYYLSGEKAWFRAYLVNAYNHIPDTTSLFVYGELISPLDSIVARVRIKSKDGAFAGYLPLNEELPAGVYSTRFYTKFLENLGEDYFFTKNITIGTPSSRDYKVLVEEVNYRNKKMELDLAVIDINTGEKVIPEDVFIVHTKEEYAEKDIFEPIRTEVSEAQTVSYEINLSEELPRSIYVEYKVNGTFCSEYVSIPSPKEEFHIDFFPEGGHFLSNADNKIAFKALGSNGLSQDITISVYTEEGDTVCVTDTKNKGMGTFNLQGVRNKNYYAFCKNKDGYSKTFALPKSIEKGYVLKANKSDDLVALSVNTNTGLPEGLIFLMHIRGQVLDLFKWNNDDNYVAYSNKALPSGVIQCLLLNKEGYPVSERLIFNINDEEFPNITQSNNKSKYNKRDLVVSAFEVKNKEGLPVNGSFSIAVTDDKSVVVDSTQNILTTMLLTSELKGHIEDPSSYFQSQEDSRDNIDLLMLTQGWRRYDMEKVLSGNIQRPTIPIELVYSISGNVMKDNIISRRVAENIPVYLSDFRLGGIMETKTDRDGNFSFVSLFPDSLYLSVWTTPQKKLTRFELKLNEESFPKLTNNLLVTPTSTLNPITKDYITKADMMYTMENGMRIIHLQDISVFASKSGIRKRKSIYSSSFNKTIDVANLSKGTTLKTALLMNGITIKDDKAYIRLDNIPALMMVDDIPESVSLGDGDENSQSLILALNPNMNEIENIEIIRDAGSAFYGMKAGGGVVLITTKRGLTSLPDAAVNFKAIKPLGFQSYVEFYSPKYETITERNSVRPDLRTTIYWNPNVKIIDGMAKVEFYVGDDPESYSVFIEGISDNGDLIHTIKSY